MAKPKYVEWLEPEGLIMIEGWARDGLSEKQIAYNMGIGLSTFKVWKNKYVAIMASLKKGKMVVDREVENALHKSATGYFVEEVETYIEKVGDKEKKKIKKTKRWIPANTASQIYWLKNRKPEVWRERREDEQSTTSNIVIVDKWSESNDE